MKKFALILTAGFVFPALANAGWMIDSKSSDGDNRKTYIEGAVLCDETEGDYTIIDMKSGQLTVVNHKAKTYAVSSVDEMKKNADAFKVQTEKAMADNMKNVPPEQQAAYKKMMGMDDGKTADVKIKKIGDEKVAGFNATKYQVLSDNTLVEEVWVSSDVPFFNDDFKKYSGSLSEAMSGMGGKDYTDDKAYVDLMKTGYPVKQRTINDMNMMGMPSAPGMPDNWLTEEVKSVKQMDVTKNITVPAGYKKNSYMDLVKSMDSDND